MKKEEALLEVEVGLENGQRICGRFPTSWLEPLPTTTPSLKRKSMLAWKWLGVGIIWFQLESIAQLKTPVPKKPIYAYEFPSFTKANSEKDTVLKEEGFWIHGVVRDDETCEPVPFATIRVDQIQGAIADTHGFYRVFIPVAIQKYGPKIIIKATSAGYFTNQSTLWISELRASSLIEFNPIMKLREAMQSFTVGMLISSDVLFEDRRPASRGLFHITKIVKPKVNTVRFVPDSGRRRPTIFSRFFRFLSGR